MRQRRLNRRCRVPGRLPVSKATAVAAATDADSSGRWGRDCVRRSDVASALEDGPKLFENVSDNVMLHPQVRKRLVCLLTKRQ